MLMQTNATISAVDRPSLARLAMSETEKGIRPNMDGSLRPFLDVVDGCYDRYEGKLLHQ